MRVYRTIEFDTKEKRDKYIKEVIEGEINQLSDYPMWVSDKFEQNGKFYLEYSA